MSLNLGLGILCAILSGLVNAVVNVMQKSVINRLMAKSSRNNLVIQYVRDPVWIAGLVVSFVFGTSTILAATSLIGPALVPALTSSGLVFLALISSKILKEKIRPLEWLGIFLLVAGITLVSLSRLVILQSEVDVLDRGTQFRLASFTIGMLVAWGLSWFVATRLNSRFRGTVMAISSGLPYGIANLWQLFLLMTIFLVFSGHAGVVRTIIFILSCFLLVFTNVFGISQTQEAYRFTPASKAIPLQQIPAQIAPILIYFLVFQRSIDQAALYLVPLGVLFILIGGFLLGKRQEEMQPIRPITDKLEVA
jgi:drug/metabolite transporter (DMT)-like permease